MKIKVFSSVVSATAILLLSFSFFLTGCGNDITEEEIVAEELAIITSDDLVFADGEYEFAVRSSFTVPVLPVHESTAIEWTSSHPELVSIDIEGAASVTRPGYFQGDTEITLTVTATNGASSQEKQMKLTILASTTVSEVAILYASDAQEGDNFGCSIAIDGDYMVIGAYGEDGGTGDPLVNCGAAYVFTKNGTGWVQEAILHAGDFEDNDNFGSSVAISGNYIVVGAPLEDGPSSGTVSNSGSAYIFQRTASGWDTGIKIRASNPGINDSFGDEVAIQNEYILIGAFYEDGPADSEVDSGAVYCFKNDGSTWMQRQILRLASPTAGDTYGNSISMNGSTALIGAVGKNIGSSTSCGAAYIYSTDGVSWTEKAEIYSNDNQDFDAFGEDVFLSDDCIIIGAPHEDGAADIFGNCGAAYIFTKSGTGWDQTQKLYASNGGDSDFFGTAAVINSKFAIVGSYGEDGSVDNILDYCGAFYVIENNPYGYSQNGIFRASDAETSMTFGFAVSMVNGFVFSSAPNADEKGLNAGAVYVYR